MSIKSCPNCGTEVPAVANLCKHCFHDFHMVIPPRKSPLLTIVTLAASTAIVAAMAFSYIHEQSKTTQVQVNQETKEVTFITKYADHMESDVVPFKEISTIEYVMNARPRPFEIALVTTRGDRHVYQQSDEPIDYQAQQLGSFIDKPVVNRDLFDSPTMLKKKQ